MTLRILVFIAVTHSTFAIASDAVNLAEATLALQNWQKKIISIRVQSVQRGEEKTNVMIREASLKHTLGGLPHASWARERESILSCEEIVACQ